MKAGLAVRITLTYLARPLNKLARRLGGQVTALLGRVRRQERALQQAGKLGLRRYARPLEHGGRTEVETSAEGRALFKIPLPRGEIPWATTS